MKRRVALRALPLILWSAVVLLGPTPALRAGDPNIELELQMTLPLVAGQVVEALPPTFVLLENGRFFLGGTSVILEGRLTGADQKPLRELVERIKKIKGLGAQVTFGPGAVRYTLRLKTDREIVATGDPDQAPLPLRPVAALVMALSRFDHASLRQYLPERFRLIAKNEALIGGCRPYTLPVPIREALQGPRIVPGSAVAGWPTGANPASVCVGDRTYTIALRPLLPWE
jgi:hypothetical protein